MMASLERNVFVLLLFIIKCLMNFFFIMQKMELIPVSS